MTYSFNPLSDEELDAINLIPEGEYNFEVVRSERQISKANNPMAKLQLKVWDNEGKTHVVFDYLVFSNISLNIKKVSHFCKAVGLEDGYKKGCIPEDLARYCGKLSLGIQEEQMKPGGGTYPKKNVVVDYIKLELNEGMKPLPAKSENDFVDDKDIPF